MELRQLRYFLAVVEECHLTRAAEGLGIRPTSLSQQIIALERELGAALFVRTPAGMSPTDAARRLVPDARAAVEAAARAAKAVRGRPSPVRAAVTPGTPPWVADALWRAAGAAAPEVADLQTADQLAALQDGRLDVGVVLLPEDVGGLACVTVADAELGVVVADAHPLADWGEVSWSDLTGNALLWFPRTAAPGYHDATREAWVQGGWTPREIRCGSPRRSLFRAELAAGARDADAVVALRPAWDVRAGDGLVWLRLRSPVVPRIRHGLVWDPRDLSVAQYAGRATELLSEATPHEYAAMPRGHASAEAAVVAREGAAPREAAGGRSEPCA
ncbi:LysR family transcriptional regulator [Yinghuangia soli]|uniref:LysR family transcriptional regulator n=1 Tax=Yinghuangia soli TaxID=2908204 RepID=A0AA41Q5V0_9ACTN|nr:LysR family transcriptional regulator [Yinghuangia soli]MCF2532128.1 LysR family transcriptional regulator [Yinghuangia soli]